MPTMYGQAGSYQTAMDPNKTPSSFQWANAYLGASTSLEPGKAMKDLLSLPASGIENVEISVIDPQKFESMPREVFSEARRLGKLLIRDFTKDGRPTPISVHAPMMESTGFSENKWDESHWRATQQHLNSIVEKAALVGPNVPLNVHASQLPADQTRYDPKLAERVVKEFEIHVKNVPDDEKFRPYINKIKETKEVPEMMTVVDPTTGQLVPLQAKEHMYPWNEKRILLPFEQLDMINRTQWDELALKLRTYWKEIQEAERYEGMATTKKDAEAWHKHGEAYAGELQREALHIFERVARADENSAKKIQEEMKGMTRAQQMEHIIAWKDRETPPGTLFTPTYKFALPKAAETFASAAMKSYELASNPEKFLGKEAAKEIRAAGIMGVAQAPIITIENETDKAFARGESLKSLVDASREKFVEKLVAEKKVPHQKAEEIAKQIIGATWDVGHVNLMRRYGYNEDQIAKEIEAIKKDVKHVHIHDNFGSFDAHLAPGMGNVPIKKILEQLQTDGKMPKGVRGIVEAGGYVMNFGENPTPHTLKYFNSPAYGQGAPSWGGEAPMLGGYFMGTSQYSAGYGLMLPPIHYSEYGSGFTGLPPSLAAVPGSAQKSQFAGTPNA